jgi:hypothetical protein
MASHAPPIQPALVPHHVNQGLVLLLVGLVIVPLALVGIVTSTQITATNPRTESAALDYLVSHRAAERASWTPVVLTHPAVPYAPSIYYSASSALSGVHGPRLPYMPGIYYSASSALSGVHGPFVPYAPSVYYSASSALSGVHGPFVPYAPSVYYSASSALSGVLVGASGWID